jgi:hypothetical protein
MTRARLRTIAATSWGVLVAALTWFFLLRLGGAVAIVTGVYLLAGLGWACISAGTFAVIASEFIRRGVLTSAA